MSRRREIWISSRSMTLLVGIDRENIIVSAPPIARKFVGQPIGALRKWMDRQGGLRVEELAETETA